MTQHKINRKIKEMGMSIYGYLVLLYFFLHPKPNLLLVAQYSVHKVLSIWICGLLGNDLKKKKKYGREDQSVSAVESQGQSALNQRLKIRWLLFQTAA